MEEMLLDSASVIPKCLEARCQHWGAGCKLSDTQLYQMSKDQGSWWPMAHWNIISVISLNGISKPGK
jgi:hypothetical protein